MRVLDLCENDWVGTNAGICRVANVNIETNTIILTPAEFNGLGDVMWWRESYTVSLSTGKLKSNGLSSRHDIKNRVTWYNGGLFWLTSKPSYHRLEYTEV